MDIMGSVIVSLLPLIIGSAVVPLHVILVVLLLTSEKQPVGKAIGYVSGMTVVRLAQGVLFGLILTEGGAKETGSLDAIVSTLLLVLGILLLLSAYKKWAAEPDPDAPPPKWLTLADKLTPLTAFAMGVGILLIAAKMWVFTLSAIGVIGEAQLGQPSSAIAFLLFVLLAQALLIISILIRLIFPTRATALLEGASEWLLTNNRVIVIAASLIFGLYFLYKGVTGLLAL